MQQLKILNKDLNDFISFLDNLEIADGRASRGRSKLLKFLADKLKEYSDDVEEIRRPYFKENGKGELIVDGDHYVFKDESKKRELNGKILNLSNDECVINYEEYAQKMKTLYKFLNSYSEPLKGKDAGCYDQLLSSFEESYGEDDK